MTKKVTFSAMKWLLCCFIFLLPNFSSAQSESIRLKSQTNSFWLQANKNSEGNGQDILSVISGRNAYLADYDGWGSKFTAPYGTEIKLAVSESLNSLVIYKEGAIDLLDVSKTPKLKEITAYQQVLEGDGMTNFIKTLPNRTDKEAGKLYITLEGTDADGEDIWEDNVISDSDVAIANKKNWKVYKGSADYGNITWSEIIVEQQELKKVVITIPVVENGSLTLEGVNSGDEVEQGKTINIKANPDEGYVLEQLSVGGVDVKATMSFVVGEDNTIVATFKKASTVITIPSVENGTLTLKGVNSGDEVKIGQEISIKVSPAEGYELETLSVGGVDVKKTMKFTVGTDNTISVSFKRVAPVTASASIRLKSFKNDVWLKTNGQNILMVLNGGDGVKLLAYEEGWTKFYAASNVEMKIGAKSTLSRLTINKNSGLTMLDVSKAKELKEITCFQQKLRGQAMTDFINSLPDRTGKETGKLYALISGRDEKDNALWEDNKIVTSDVAIAKSKNWTIYKGISESGALTWDEFSGDVVVCEDITEKDFMGKYACAKANPDAFADIYEPYKLSPNSNIALATKVRVTPMLNKGWQLDKLFVIQGNEKTDITQSKEFVTKGNFKFEFKLSKQKEEERKKAVITIPKVENGRLTLEGVNSGDEVALGTEIKIKVSPKEGYELETLSVGGVDLKEAMKFTVGEDNTIVVKFVKKVNTAIEDVNPQVKLYPNPAQDFAFIRGLQANELVKLIDLRGKILLIEQTNALGEVKLELKSLNAGLYLVHTAKEVFKLQIK